MKQVAIVLAVAAVVTTGRADIINVPGDHPTIQAAIDAAGAGDEIIVAPGEYLESVDFLGKAVTLRSVDPDDPAIVDGTVINGNGASHVVQLVSGEPSSTVLSGFTLTGGNADGDDLESVGGGILILSSSPTIMNCVITGNLASYGGGGMASGGGDPTIVDCVIVGNMAGGSGAGGGLWIATGGATVTGCSFIDNTGVSGAGLRNDSSATVTNCVFHGNVASGSGGGICSLGPSAVINCMFVANIAGEGGGICHAGKPDQTMVNCSFSGNSATLDDGGGLVNVGSGVSMMTNCVMWGDAPNEISVQGPGGATVSYSIVQGGFAGAGNVDADPMFADPAGGDLRLLAGSPGIDAGLNSVVPAGVDVDLDGNPRFVDDPDVADCPQAPGTCGAAPVVDIGAYEHAICQADVNGDQTVDVTDLVFVILAWGQAGGAADLNGDGTVDVLDLIVIIVNWGSCV